VTPSARAILALMTSTLRGSRAGINSLVFSFGPVDLVAPGLQELGGEEPAHVSDHGTGTYQPSGKGKNDQDCGNELGWLQKHRCSSAGGKKRETHEHWLPAAAIRG
jgi:hypothetical protein